MKLCFGGLETSSGSWGPLGVLGGLLGASCESLGGLLWVSWRSLGGLLGLLVASWGRLASLMVALEGDVELNIILEGLNFSGGPSWSCLGVVLQIVGGRFGLIFEGVYATVRPPGGL